MGFNLGDSHDFDKFWLKDMFSNIGDDPWRLLTGIDPFATGMWNKILGRDDDPLVNVLGGPYGGAGNLGLSSDGGIYQDARDAGINTSSGNQAHDVAEVVTLLAATNGAGGFGGGEGGGFLGNLSGGDYLNYGNQLSGLLGGGQSQPDNTAHQQAVELERLKRQSARGLL